MDRGFDVNLRSAPQMLEYAAIVQRIAADAPASILDWGCGLGKVSDMLLTAGLNVTSFDYRPDAPQTLSWRSSAIRTWSPTSRPILASCHTTTTHFTPSSAAASSSTFRPRCEPR